MSLIGEPAGSVQKIICKTCFPKTTAFKVKKHKTGCTCEYGTGTFIRHINYHYSHTIVGAVEKKIFEPNKIKEKTFDTDQSHNAWNTNRSFLKF